MLSDIDVAAVFAVRLALIEHPRDFEAFTPPGKDTRQAWLAARHRLNRARGRRGRHRLRYERPTTAAVPALRCHKDRGDRAEARPLPTKPTAYIFVQRASARVDHVPFVSISVTSRIVVALACVNVSRVGVDTPFAIEVPLKVTPSFEVSHTRIPSLSAPDVQCVLVFGLYP